VKRQPRRQAGVRREIVLWTLLAVYACVSVVAHTDYPRRSDDPLLNGLEQDGLRLWRANNCQACHQIYGFGGFLGPDLTNRVNDDTPDDTFWWILRDGLGRMPAFDFGDSEREALMAYLRAVNRTGRSQPPPLGARVAVDPWKHFSLITAEWIRDTGRPIDESIEDGEAVWLRNQCGACHVPFAEGRHQSPDLSLRARDRSVPTMQELLDNGRGWMPAYMLDRDEVESVHAYLEWIASRRVELVDLNDRMLEREGFAWTAVPWFQYE